MEAQAYRELYLIIWRLGQRHRSPHVVFPNHLIVCVFFWSVLHDRPVDWACQRRNWPRHARHRLPSGSTLSRRLRRPEVQALIQDVHQLLISRVALSTIWHIDARPLPVGHASGDRDAKRGYAGHGIAKGYKMHAVYNASGVVTTCIVRPMNEREPTVARGLIPDIPGPGVLVGDNAYDSNELYDLAGAGGLQLIAPTKQNAKDLGHRQHSPYRLHVRRDMTKTQRRQWYKQRDDLERAFGRMATKSGCLAPLPAFVRGLYRVTRWVQAKLIIFHLLTIE